MLTHSCIRRCTRVTFSAAAFVMALAVVATAQPARDAVPAPPSRPTTAAPAPTTTTTTIPAVPGRSARAVSEAAVTSDYVLSVGDKLRIEVYKDTQLSQSLQIRPDGRITLPLVGDLAAAGLTPLALDETITTALKEYMTNPVVTVIVVEATPPTVYVMGEVNAPGPVPMRPGMTALEALALAGGFKDFAKTSDIRIIRRGGSGELMRFNYKDAINGGERAVALKPGDTIVVP
jgi:polysaccharide biosynthesis/export protein